MLDVKVTYWTLLVAIAFGFPLMTVGCSGSMLLDREYVKRLSAPPDDEPHIVYYTDKYFYASTGTLQRMVYQIVRLGSGAGPRL